MGPLRSLLSRFRRDERGVALVEFAIVVPVMLLILFVAVESGRIMWSYQAAIAGVRDASRYLGRVVPTDVCAPGKVFPNLDGQLAGIVSNRLGGTDIFPAGVSLAATQPVTSTLVCVPGAYRVSPVPVGVVTARVAITFPFSGILRFFGVTQGPITATITDRMRILGS